MHDQDVLLFNYADEENKLRSVQMTDTFGEGQKFHVNVAILTFVAGKFYIKYYEARKKN